MEEGLSHHVAAYFQGVPGTGMWHDKELTVLAVWWATALWGKVGWPLRSLWGPAVWQACGGSKRRNNVAALV